MKNWFKWIKYFAFLLLGVYLMYVAFEKTDPSKLIEDLKAVDLKWPLYSIIFGFLAIISRGLRWVYLLNGMGFDVKKSNSIYAVSIGYVTNIAIPRAGEISRCTSLNQTEKIPVDKLFGTIILERAIDFLFLFLLLGLTFILKIDVLSDYVSQKININSSDYSQIISATIVSIAIASAIFYLLRKRISKSKLFTKLKSILKGVKDGLLSINQLQNKWGFWGHTVVIWLMYLFMTYICFFAYDELKILNLIDGLYIMIVGGLGMVVPVPGGFGAYHNAVIFGFELIGIKGSVTENFAFVVHSAQTLMTLVFGGISILMVFLIKRKSNE